MDIKSVYKDISLDVIIAEIMRKAVLIILCALIGLFVVLGLSFVKSSGQSANEAYLTQVEEYEKTVALYKSKIGYLEELQSELSTRSAAEYSIKDAMELNERKTVLESEMEALKVPEEPSFGLSKRKLALGFLAGGFISLLCIVICFMSSNPVVLSYDAERRLEIPLIGALFQSNGVFDRIARRIVGERAFKDCDVAKEQIKNNITCLQSLPEKGSKITILCSTKDKKIEKAAETVCSIIADNGFSPVFISEVPQNPEAIKAVLDSEVVFLLEEQWKSKWIQVASCTALVERCCKRIAGLILC